MQYPARFGAEAIRHGPIVGIRVRKVGAQPRAAHLPREAGRRGSIERGRDVSLVGPRVAAAPRVVDHERLIGLPARVTRSGDAPGGEVLVLMAGPCARGGHARARLRYPLGPAGRLPLVAPVLLAIAICVTTAEREAATQGLGPIGARGVNARQPTGVVSH